MGSTHGEEGGTPAKVELRILTSTGDAGNERGSVIRGTGAGSGQNEGLPEKVGLEPNPAGRRGVEWVARQGTAGVQAVGTACSKAHVRNSEARCQEQTRPGTGVRHRGQGQSKEGPPCLPKVNIPVPGLAPPLRDGSKEEGWGAECSKSVGPEPLLGVDWST